MFDELLISIADFKPYKDISEHMDIDRVNEYIRDTQVLDVRPFLGKELYLLLVSDYDPVENTFTDPVFQSLFFGVDENGIRFYGLKPMLVQYTYARMIEDININLTRTGVRQFNAEESEPVPESMITAKANTARSVAIAYQIDTETYLNANKDKYPKWAPTDIKTTGVNFFKVP